VDELDVMTVAKGMEALFKAALAPSNADYVRLSRDEAVITLGLLSALVDILESDGQARS